MANLPQFLIDLEGESEWIRNHGPFTCARCDEPFNDVTAYCSRCGKITHVFAQGDSRRQCPIHKLEPPIGFCNLCQRPVCETCRLECEVTETPRTFYCRECKSNCARLESVFLKEIFERGVCPRHRDAGSSLRCRDCKLPVCNDCAYVWVRGLIFKRIVKGPFCQACKFKNTPSEYRTGGIAEDGAISGALTGHLIDRVCSRRQVPWLY